MTLLVAHQHLSNAKDFGTDEAGQVLTSDHIEQMMEDLTMCSREAMGLITIGKQYLKDVKQEAASSSSLGPHSTNQVPMRANLFK